MKTKLKQNKLSKHLASLSLFSLIFAAWYYMIFLMTMNMAPVAQWSYSDVVWLFIMWAIMMAGMMLPSATPIFKLIEQINLKRRARQATYASSLYFVLGYLLVWLLYSVIITLLQWWLHHLALLSPMMKSSQLWFTCVLLIMAGIYQWLPIKQYCLSRCRSPLGFLTSSWQEGINGAIKMGFSHGQYCLGCCWILMALLLAFGVMNLQWIIALTLLVAIEKLSIYGQTFSKILGLMLILLALYLGLSS